MHLVVSVHLSVRVCLGYFKIHKICPFVCDQWAFLLVRSCWSTFNGLCVRNFWCYMGTIHLKGRELYQFSQQEGPNTSHE